ncbi:MAG: tetratricopeptide repeat protein [Deltaproteobacteria bacterium]|nr:tetratricopeptide repeat protein [Deltaproteobacteria bacterium]
MFIIFLISLHVGYAHAADCAAAAGLVKKGVELADGSPEEAKHYRDAIELCSGLSEAHYNLGLNLAKANQVDEAIKEFDVAIKGRKEGDFLIGLANAYVQKKEFSRAREIYEDALKLEPSSTKATQGLALAYVSSEDFEKAEDVLRAAIQQNPDDAESYFSLGVVLDRLGRNKEAMVSYETAIEKGKKSPEVYAHLGGVVLKDGDVERAGTILQTVLASNPDNAVAHNNMGVLLELKGEKDNALREFRRAMDLDPNLESASKNFFRLSNT